MTEHADRQQLRDRRMNEPGAAEAYEATRLAFELGKTVRGDARNARVDPNSAC